MASIEKRIYDANRAKEVLENEAFQQAFADIEAEFTKQWKDSPARDQEGREKIWIYLSILNKVKTHLETTLETGKLAQLEIEHRSAMERMKNFLQF